MMKSFQRILQNSTERLFTLFIVRNTSTQNATVQRSSTLSFYALSRLDHVQRMLDLVQKEDKQELIEYLKTADSGYLSTVFPFEFNKTLTFPFVPTIESPKANDAFITESPEEIYNSGKVDAKDVMFSFNSKEVLGFRPNFIGKNDSILTEDIEDGDVSLPFEGFNKTLYPKEYKRSLEILKAAYYPTNDTSAMEEQNINFLSDLMFDDSILKAVKLQSIASRNGVDEKSHKNTFLFRFSMYTDLNLLKFKSGIEYEGASHGDDGCYYFHCHRMDQSKVYDKHLKQKDEVYDAIVRIVKIITNFARTGNPSLKNDTPFKSCESPNEIFCQEISNNPRSSVTTDIEDQLHYKTWRLIEEIYKNLKI